MRCADDADVHRDFAVVAHPRDMLFLQHAQKLDLHIEREFADFVEKNRTAVGFFKKALLIFDGARKRTLRMPEHERFHQVLRNGSAVHGDERFFGTRAMLVDVARHHFLARARLATDDHRERKRGKFVGHGNDIDHRF